MQCVCSQCSTIFDCSVRRFNRSKNIGSPIYCSRACSGLARRICKSEEQKKQEKAKYDAEYRRKNNDRIKSAKKSYYIANRKTILKKMTSKRPKRMAAHVEYCRRPEYVEYKRKYDMRRRAVQQFGEFSESFLVLQQVKSEILKRASRYEIGLTNETINKAQKRRRDLCSTN